MPSADENEQKCVLCVCEHGKQRARTPFLLFQIVSFFFSVEQFTVCVQTLLICRNMLIHMSQCEPEMLAENAMQRKAYHMFSGTITASVTHSSWLPFLMNLNRAILFYVYGVFFPVGSVCMSIYNFSQSTGRSVFFLFKFSTILVSTFFFLLSVRRFRQSVRDSWILSLQKDMHVHFLIIAEQQ